MSLLDRPGLALYTIPAAFVVNLAPHVYAITQMGKLEKKTGGKGFDNSSPRSSVARIAADANQTPLHRRILRAEAAQQNGFEVIGTFAAAVVASTVTRTNVRSTNILALAYIASRILFSLLYIRTESEKASNARSAAYFTGLGLISALAVRAGNALAARL